MTRAQREVLSQRICNFYCDAANKSVKTTVNYFKKQNIPQNTVYYILKKYLRYGTTKDLPRSGRPVKLSTKDLNRLVKSVSNRCARSQRKLGRRFRVHQSTISRNLRQRTSVIIRKRKKAPKMDSMYLKEFINRRLLPFVDKYHSNGNILFWPDLARSYYSKIVQQRLNEKNILYVSLVDNPPNVPQARPIEVIWTILERKIYENNWEANNIDHLVRRIKQKIKELDQQMLQNMMEGVRRKLRTIWRDGLYSIC